MPREYHLRQCLDRKIGIEKVLRIRAFRKRGFVIKILLLSGMTPDQRVFCRLLPQLPNAIVVEWIQPTPFESILSYASRLSQGFDSDEPTVVCGVSFGGIVARELASRLNARACVLIASVRSPGELPPWFRICRLLPPRITEAVLKAIGAISNH